MHVIEHIIMSEAEQKEKGQEVKVETATNGGSDGGNTERLQALEAKALAEATATADAAFVPMTSLWNAMTPQPLLSQVDGPSLAKYHGKESVYVGRSVPVGAGKSLRVPIQVSTPGSVVEYSVENKSLDIGFGITAEREQGITIVKETSRIDASMTPVSNRFLIGSVPCLITFCFENEYSYFREKVVSYKVIVKPPALETLKAGRRHRAQACLKAIEDDTKISMKSLEKTKTNMSTLQNEIDELQRQLEEYKLRFHTMEKEEKTLTDKIELRTIQSKELTQRLEYGWEDEIDPRTKKMTTTTA